MYQSKRKWSVLASGIIIMLLIGLQYAWSIFRPYLSAMFPTWTATNLSTVFTVSMVVFSVSMFICGKLQIKWGCKVTLLIAAALMCIGFLGASTLDASNPGGSYTRLILFYGVFCGAAVGFGYNTSLSVVPFWFPKNFGLIVGVLMMAYGISSLILGGATQVIIQAYNIMTAFRVLAVVSALLMFVAAFLMKRAPQIPASEKDGKERLRTGRDYTTAQMLGTATFWLCMIAGVVRAAGGLAVINSAATIALYYGAPAIVGMMVSFFNALGRISAGAIHDRFGYRVGLLLNAFVGLSASICLIFGNLTRLMPIILCGFAFAGLAYGGANPVLMAFMKETFGEKYYATNVGIAGLTVLPASFLGPLITGALQDASPDTNLYGTTFIAMLVLYGMNTIFTFLYLTAMKKMKEREKLQGII